MITLSANPSSHSKHTKQRVTEVRFFYLHQVLDQLNCERRHAIILQLRLKKYTRFAVSIALRNASSLFFSRRNSGNNHQFLELWKTSLRSDGCYMLTQYILKPLWTWTIILGFKNSSGMSSVFVTSSIPQLKSYITNPPYNINQREQLIKEMSFSRRLKFWFWSSGFWSCAVMYVVTLVAKEPNPYPTDHGFVQCYVVEMIHQLSK
jgi:hypothetical protein